MFGYHTFGLTIHSEIEFPDLPASAADPDVVIRFGPVHLSQQKATLREEVISHELVGAFNLRNGDEIVIDPLPNVDFAVLRVLVIGRIMAYLMRQRGWLALHASGVLIEGRTALFLGDSGSGKSTTAAAFHRFGYPVVTDDVAAVRIINGKSFVCRARSRIRLLADSRTVFGAGEPQSSFEWDKHCYDLQSENNVADVSPVLGIYVLEFAQTARLTAIPAASAVALLSRHSFIKCRRMGTEALEDHLRNCCALAAATPVRRLCRRRSLSEISELIGMVHDDLTSMGRS